MIPVLKLNNILAEEDFKYTLSCINRFWKNRKQLMSFDDFMFYRYYLHNPSFLKVMHKKLLPLAQEKFNTELKMSYSFLSMYIKGIGICPLHTDRPQCRYSIDLCLDQISPWPIFINDVEYLLQPNEALLYSGVEHPHYRNKIQPDNYVSLAFFHFVDADFEGDLN
jgi:hypothetical protein